MSTTFRVARADDPEVVSLLADYEAELRDQGIVLDRDEGGAVAPTEMAAPHGIFFVVEADGAALGCGGVRRLPGGVAEIKRMYVAPAARGRGVARTLLTRLEDEARALGCAAARLDTGPNMTPALRLYQSAGYREIVDYNGNPHATYWLEKRLAQ